MGLVTKNNGLKSRKDERRLWSCEDNLHGSTVKACYKGAGPNLIMKC